MTAATQSLGRTASRGAATTMGAQGLRILVQIVGIVLLARLLAPGDYGVMAMVLAIVGVGEIVRDFGLSSAAIQARTLSHGQRSNLFWINLGIGAVLTCLCAALAVPVSALYGDPRLVAVTLALAPTFLLNGFSTQFRAHLNRDFRFVALSAVEIGAQATALGVALSLAAWGWGYWALVVQQVLQVLLQAVALPILAGWWPGLARRGEPMRGLLTFGGHLVASQVLVYASRNIDSVMIGRLYGAVPLGFYNRAFQLMVLPLNQINAPASRVALPTLSRLQDDPARYARFLAVGQVVLLNVVAGVLAFSAAQAPALIAVALGPQWEPSVHLFQILAVAGFFQAAAYATYWASLSLGLMRRFFWYTVATRPLIIGLIVVGASWGVEGVAVAYTVGNALAWPIGLIWMTRGTIAPTGPLFLAALRTLLVHGAAAGLSAAATWALPGLSEPLHLLVGAVVLVAALALAAAIVPAFRRDVLGILALRRHLGRGRAATPVETESA
ncbi:MAG: lipopolysaccharide biosynthesis protein [Actinobacteria bacterium]|nr:lipopolysaccharide biosynthesis protein [Actinomycetota bacterium]